MNFPTNKLRDIIATLQTLDPDLEVNLKDVEIVHDTAGRRKLYFATTDAEQVVLHQLNMALAELNIPDDLAGAARMINDIHKSYIRYSSKLSSLQRDIDKHHYALTDLATSANNLVTQLGSLKVQLAQNSDDIDRALDQD